MRSLRDRGRPGRGRGRDARDCAAGSRARRPRRPLRRPRLQRRARALPQLGRSRKTRCGWRGHARWTRHSPACGGRSRARRRTGGCAAAAGAAATGRPPVEPTREALDAVVSGRPVALLAHDSHSLWLNSAALARADGALQVPGGVVELDDAACRRGSCARSRAGTSPTPTSDHRRRVRRRDARRAPARRLPRRHRRARQGRLARRPALLAAARGRGSAVTARLAVAPGRERGRARRHRPPRGFGSPLLRLGYIKAFMDGTLGSRTARMLDGSGVEITSREELAELSARAREQASRSPSTRSATSPTARRSTPSRRRATTGGRAASGRGSSMRSCFAGGRAALCGARRSGVGPVQPRAVRSRRRRPLLGERDERAPTPSARCSTRARSRERLRRADRGAGPARGHPRRRAADARRASRPGTPSRRSRSRRRCAPLPRPGLARRRRAPPRQAPARFPRRPRRARPRPARLRARGARRRRIVATMVGGPWTHNPPPW